MSTLAPRRSTEATIANAIRLGAQVAKLYAMQVDHLPTAPPEELLPAHTSLAADQRLLLELHIVGGIAKRAGTPLDHARLDELLELAARAVKSAEDEAPFRTALRATHFEFQRRLWADHEALGRAYDLGCYLWDTASCVSRSVDFAGAQVQPETQDELRRVFGDYRVQRIRGLLDDLQTRLDPAAVRIVGAQLNSWATAVNSGNVVFRGSDVNVLYRQAKTWCQIITGDKEPEAFIGSRDRTALRAAMTPRVLRSYGGPRRVALLALATVVALALAFIAATGDVLPSSPVLAIAGSLAGALGLSLGAIWRAISKSLDARTGELWDSALVDVITAKTLYVGAVASSRDGSGRAPRLLALLPKARSADDPWRQKTLE